jgi:hypothetical protein
MAAAQLPHRTEGEANGVGICLSGGGIRAAAFGFGALQALQARARLLYGKDCADHLAAVSGGSYVAATSTIIAAQLSSGLPVADRRDPLATGSPEEEHILTNGDYLKQWGPLTAIGNWLLAVVIVAVAAFAPWPSSLLGVSGIAAAVALLAWRRWLLTGLIFGVSAAINVAGVLSLLVAAAAALLALDDLLVRALDGTGVVEDRLLPDGAAMLLPAGLALLGARLGLRALYRTHRSWEQLALGALLLLAGVPSLVGVLDGEALPDPLGPAVLGLSLAVFSQGRPTRWRVRTLLDVPLIAFVQAGGMLCLGFTIDRVREPFERGERWPLLVGAVAFGAICSILLARVSLHHLNRDRLARCFCVRRSATPGKPVELIPARRLCLSELEPPDGPRSDRSFPRLLVCATANVDDRSPAKPVWARFQPFLFSPETCGIQLDPELVFETAQLERARRGVGLRVEPLLTLMSAVACAGAAVSPAMGRKTFTGARSIIALLNLRLGTWLPNPHCRSIRDEVAGPSRWWWRPQRLWHIRKHFVLAGGFDEFVPELYGLQRDDAPRSYISDGGHYDNLGLLALLRARCSTIWCVDSQADRRGRAGQLRHTIELALEEQLIRRVTRDGREDALYDVFGPANGSHGEGHAVYEVEYAEGVVGTLIVIKLGLTPKSDPALHAFHRRDLWARGRFPYDHTFARVAFSSERVRHYRHLGFENATRAVDAVAERNPEPAVS